ncbi:hypothetical protein [Metallosphaera sp.]|uniref:hypothetical protein n=1 Tax=Metallosphaera sp. TaxID=2020860 RepID=UPI00317F99EF
MPCQYGIQIDGFTVCFDVVVDPLINFFTDLANTIENDILSGVSAFINGLTGLVNTVWRDLLNGINGVGTVIRDALNTAYHDILSTLNTVGNTIHDALNTVYHDILSGVNTVYSFVRDDLAPAITGGLRTLSSDLSDLGGRIAQFFDTLGNDIASGIGGVVTFLHGVAVNIENGFNDAATHINSVFASVVNTVTSGFNSFVSGLEHIGDAVANGLQAIGKDLYTVLRDITNTLLADLHTLVNAFEDSMKGVQQQLMNFIKPRGRDEIQNVLSEALSLTALTSTVYIGGALAVKITENLHPIHSLHLQELFDKVTELFAVHRIPEEIVAGFFTFGIFKQFEYALNYLLRPHLTDLAVESRAVWYGVQTTDELQQSLALEGYPNDLADKYVKTLYRPMPPFILRYLIETGLASQDFLTKQLQMEGFDPQDIPTIVNIFNALELAPFQNQIKSVIYQYYKAGLMSENDATQIMNVFQIPKVQQTWILSTAKTDFELEQKQLLGSLALDLLAKAELTVDQTIEALVKIGYSEERAKVLANTRAVSQAPPPPKSTRAQILQQALQDLGALGFS